MEEVDNIIIDSLKHLHCNIDDDITSIKHFDADMVVDAVVSCLKAITPGINMPHKLSPSMSLRLKLATTISECIRELGFRGDIGYQTILYCNEVDIRRILMFLIERLPREADEDISMQETGYTYNLRKKIEEKVKLSLQKSWVPRSFLKEGIRKCENNFFKSSYNSMYSLKTVNIQIPCTQNNKSSEDFKHFWINYVKDVTKQCSNISLIPSLLFNDSDFEKVNLIEFTEDVCDNSFSAITIPMNMTITSTISKTEDKTIPNHIHNIYEDKIHILTQNIEQQKHHILELKENLRTEKYNLNKVLDGKEKEEEYLKDMLRKYKIKTRTLTVLSKDENFEKLRNLVENGNDRLRELEQQWKVVQTPLLIEHEALITNVAAAELKQQEERERTKTIKEKKQLLLEELQNKDKLEKLLKQERERLSKNTRRSAYTRRILEIIGNIKKQNEEIQKILDDTRIIQKKINSLNGQLDRSFTLSDELIFRNAKQDETSRKAYKLLATLHNDCGAIIQAITEVGFTERESRNLQEQIDIEVSKATGISLERVNADLENVKKETTLLLKQVHV